MFLFREFCKRMDNTLPFYYWTINERYTEEDLPSFDHKPNVEENVDERHHPLRLHRLKVNRREDASIFAPGSVGEHFYHPVTVLQLGNAYIATKFAYPLSWKMNKVN
jgi:hypothetical protein